MSYVAIQKFSISHDTGTNTGTHTMNPYWNPKNLVFYLLVYFENSNGMKPRHTTQVHTMLHFSLNLYVCFLTFTPEILTQASSFVTQFS